MKTIQMTIDESLLELVDKTVAALEITRSAFIRLALEEALNQYRVRRLEERDERGYAAKPARKSETADWVGERDWGDPWNEEK